MWKWCIKKSRLSRLYALSPASSPVGRDHFLEDFWVNYSLSRFSLVSSSRVLFLASPHCLGKAWAKKHYSAPYSGRRVLWTPHPYLAEKKWNNFKIVKAMATKLDNFFEIICWELIKVVVTCTSTLTFLWQPNFDSDVFPNLLFSDKKFYCSFLLWYIKIHTWLRGIGE